MKRKTKKRLITGIITVLFILMAFLPFIASVLPQIEQNTNITTNEKSSLSVSSVNMSQSSSQKNNSSSSSL